MSGRDITVSVKQAISLKAAGYQQKATFFWIKYCDNPGSKPHRVEYFLVSANLDGTSGYVVNDRTVLDTYAAPTLQELLPLPLTNLVARIVAFLS